MSLNDYDIVIVGAGLVGTSMVVALQQAGYRVAVLEKHLPAIVTPDQQDQRPLTLAYGCQRCLDQWGIWSALKAEAVPIQTLHVSEQGRLGRVQFSAEDEGLPALGYVVPFALLQRCLYQSAASQKETIFISIEDITSLLCNDEGVQVQYVAADKEQTITGKLLIAADGTHSSCRELLKIPVTENKAGDLALIATLNCEQSHQTVAYQRFTKQGSLALLPLFDRYQYRLVWTMTSDVNNAISDWSDQRLLEAINEAYGGRLGVIHSIKREAVFPLETIIAEEMVRPGMVLLGNAAHTIYPIAAQGFNLSLQDVAVLSRVLLRATQQGESLSTMSTLQRYMDKRQASQRAIIRWTQYISTLFHLNLPGFNHVRGIALLGLDSLPFVKHHFSKAFLHD